MTSVSMTENPSCQHHRVDNNKGACLTCGEQMIIQRCEAETVLSGGPNLAGCSNPACLAALDDGSYDDTHPPAGCTNPDGVYIADPRNTRTIVVGFSYTYDCRRCGNNGTLITKDGFLWSCGGAHRGE
jgi:predicted RNA-binding Zn-ribbon protein involved in translation (DUF1610 family)